MNLHHLLHNQSGNASTEYVLLVGIIAIGAIAILYSFTPIFLNLIYIVSLAVYNAWPH